jgi:DNA-binding CsgD family transcriptional regulator
MTAAARARQYSRAGLLSGLSQSLAPVVTAVDVVGVAAKTLLRAVPADVWCAVILDPSTLLDTGGIHEAGFPPEIMPRLFEIEYVEQNDVDNLRVLARRASPVSLLSMSTEGDLASSTYYRDILAPLGLADEMRVLLRDGARTWGLFVLCRAGSSVPFSRAELAAARTVAAPAAEALRQSFVRTGTDPGTIADGTGLVTLDDAQRIVAMSRTAQLLVADLQEDGLDEDQHCPYALRALAAQARTVPVGESVRSHARTRSGRWVSLNACVMGEDDVLTIAIGPPELSELMAVVLDAYGLSPRHRQITEMVLRGRSTEEIMTALRLSKNTLAGYFTKIFETIGVRNRSELAGVIFLRHYQPRLGHGQLTLDGRLMAGLDDRRT